MIEDMTVRGLGASTQQDYVRCVRMFAASLGRSPDTATADDLRCWQLHQREQGVQPPSFNSSVSALRFVLGVTPRPRPVPGRGAPTAEAADGADAA
jgi:hypothetical protein